MTGHASSCGSSPHQKLFLENVRPKARELRAWCVASQSSALLEPRGLRQGLLPTATPPLAVGTTPTYLSPFICICRLRHRAMLAHQLNSHLAALPHAYSGRPCRGGACGAARRPLPVRSFMGSLENLVRRPCFPPVCCERAASGVSPACQLATWGARLPDGLPQPVPRCGCGCRRAG